MSNANPENESVVVTKKFAPADEHPTAFITSGKLSASVWRLALPTVMTTLLQTANWTLDMFFLKPFGTTAQAAVGTSGQFMFMVASAVMAVTTGSTALVARFTGARDVEQASQAAKQSIVLGLIGSLLLVLLLFATMHPALVLLGLKPDVRQVGISYLTILTVFLPFGIMLFIGTAIFRGLGNMWTPLWISGTVDVLNIVLDYMLIYGLGPLPRLGVNGAALAASLSRVVGACLCFWFLRRTAVWRHPSPWRPQWDWFRRILNIGIPAAFHDVLSALARFAFVRILAMTPQATAAIAASVIGIRIESWAFMPAFAFSMAATTIVGQNLGARQPERAQQAGWHCAAQCAALLTLVALPLVLLPGMLMRIFSTEPAVIHLGIGYLIWNGLAEPLIGVGMVLTGALRGAGDTAYPLWISMVAMWGIRVGGGVVFCLLLGYGAHAAWPVMFFSMLVYTALVALRFQSGKWKSLRV
ncbi:MAG: MATE family efflux transporter [Abditibacteriales bacterium]|nr:MATE family efflux transporter [Abditibacteriales bacterium]MDW8366394.1 MATE family efflux transporter [Abditibacteriales bacterium]